MFSGLVRSIFLYTLLLAGAIHTSYGQMPAIGHWRTHLPYTKGVALADAGDKIYCLGNVSFFSYSKSDGAIQKYDKVNGLSDVQVTNIAYSRGYKTLVVVYDNANIDLIINNEIINISDVKRANIIGSRNINSIYMADSLAYLSCSFGIVVLDIKNREIHDSYFIGANGTQINVRAVTCDTANIYAATDSGVYVASLSAPNLANFQYWTLQGTVAGMPFDQPATDIINYRNAVIAAITVTGTTTETILYRYSPSDNTWDSVYHQPGWQLNGLDTADGHLYVAESGNGARISELNANLLVDSILPGPHLGYPVQTLRDDQGTLWVADLITGFIRFANGASDVIQVNGPGSTAVTNMSFANGSLWVATAGFDNLKSFAFNADGFFSFSNEQWRTYSQYTTSGLDTFSNISSVVADPNSNDIYLSSLYYGVMIWNNGQIKRYDQYNSILQGRTGDFQRTYVTALALDYSQNLWMGNFGANYPLVLRKADGTWNAFRPSTFTIGGGFSQIVVDDNGYLWCIQTQGNGGIAVYNPGTNIDDPSDDQWRYLTNVKGSGNLPSSNVLSMAKDKDGSIWVGTDAGIAVFYCPGSTFTTSGCDAQQIIVSNSGFNGYLLGTENVTVITVDGGNRKWVGTTNGLWLFSPDGTKQLAYYTVENSPLLSNSISAITINDNTGEVFVGTSKGIISFRAEAIAATDSFNKQTVCVFPNPVKETYSGPIAIRCLAQDSEVKITDAGGALVYQTTSVGGQATWTGFDYNGRKANTGVYLVFAVNKDGTQSFVTKFLLVH